MMIQLYAATGACSTGWNQFGMTIDEPLPLAHQFCWVTFPGEMTKAVQCGFTTVREPLRVQIRKVRAKCLSGLDDMYWIDAPIDLADANKASYYMRSRWHANDGCPEVWEISGEVKFTCRGRLFLATK